MNIEGFCTMTGWSLWKTRRMIAEGVIRPSSGGGSGVPYDIPLSEVEVARAVDEATKTPAAIRLAVSQAKRREHEG